MPLHAEPEDPAVRERLAAFTESYEFAELPPSSGGLPEVRAFRDARLVGF